MASGVAAIAVDSISVSDFLMPPPNMYMSWLGYILMQWKN
jgi:hypothetical protein